MYCFSVDIGRLRREYRGECCRYDGCMWYSKNPAERASGVRHRDSHGKLTHGLSKVLIAAHDL